MFKRYIYLVLVIALVLVASSALTACSTSKDEVNDSPTYITLDSRAAFERFIEDNNAVIVDVRNPNEWAATGIPVGAVLIPLPEFTTRGPAELPRDKNIYVICNSGNRSKVAAQILIDEGFQHVINVDGGIKAWLGNGFPTEAYTP